MLRLILLLIILMLPLNAFALRLTCELPEEIITACEVEINGIVHEGSCILSEVDYELIDLIPHITDLEKYMIRARWMGEVVEDGYSNWSNLYILFVDRKFVRDYIDTQLEYDVPGFGKGQW